MDYQQHYPTYNYKERDVVLLEFEEAQKIANSRSKLYGQLANLLIAFLTIGLTLLFKSVEDSSGNYFETVKDNLIILNLLFIGVSYVILRYFIELQRTIVINSRKVVTLRSMLGLDYGNLQLTVPNWRVEGATNPFVIKLFPGWFKFGSSPFWIIVMALNLIWYLSSDIVLSEDSESLWYLVNIGITIFFICIYRYQLKELHETIYLLWVKSFAFILRIKLVPDFEYILYRGKLSIFEKVRLNYKTDNFEKILVLIEDTRFFTHRGVDFKALLRGFLSVSNFIRKRNNIIKSGGSTISMQLTRTLFIPSNQKKFSRKIIEVLLSFWLDKQFKKNEILGLYMSSARFEKGIHGVIAARKHFFPLKKDHNFSNEEAFFLVERLSNVTSTYKIERVKSLFNKCNETGNLNWITIQELYLDQEKAKRIKQITK